MYEKKIAKAKEQVQALLSEVKAIGLVAETENREFTADETARMDAVTGESGEITSLTANIDKWSKAESAIANAIVQTNAIQAQRDGGSPGNSLAIRVPARARSRQPLKAFSGPDAEADAYASGQFIRATIGNNASAREWCRDHGVTAAMGENNDLLGGVLVVPQFESAIINLKEQFGLFGQYVRNVPMTSEQWIGPRRLSGLTAYAVSEAQEITTSDATFNQVSLTAKKFGTLTRISSELNEDAIISIADFLAQEIAYAHAVKEDNVGFLGNGLAVDNGIVGLANALAAGSIATAASGIITAGALTIAVFQDAVSKLPQFPGIRPVWFVHSAVYWNVMSRLQLAAGGNSVADLGSGPVMQFMGYPVVFAQTLPSLIEASTKFAYFGDLSMAATKGTRRGITIAADNSRYFEFDQLAIRSTLRYDVAIHERGTATVAGPIVQLATPAS